MPSTVGASTSICDPFAVLLFCDVEGPAADIVAGMKERVKGKE